MNQHVSDKENCKVAQSLLAVLGDQLLLSAHGESLFVNGLDIVA